MLIRTLSYMCKGLTQFVTLFIKSRSRGGGTCIASIWRLRHKCVEPVLSLYPHVGPGD